MRTSAPWHVLTFSFFRIKRGQGEKRRREEEEGERSGIKTVDYKAPFAAVMFLHVFISKWFAYTQTNVLVSCETTGIVTNRKCGRCSFNVLHKKTIFNNKQIYYHIVRKHSKDIILHVFCSICTTIYSICLHCFKHSTKH